MLIHYAVLFLFLLTAVADTLAGEVFRFRRIDVNNGLPQSFVNTIGQDSTGFLWIATQDGLVRYDGQNIKVFALGNVHTLRFAGSLLHANTGRGWYSYQPSHVTFVRSVLPIDSVLPNVVGRIRDRKGRMWTAMRHGGVFVSEQGTNATVRFSTSSPLMYRLPTNEITSITEDHRGRIWLGTNGWGVVIINNMHVDTILRNDQSDPESISNDVVSSLFCDRDGVVWIGTHGSGACSWDPNAHLVSSYVVGPVVSDAQDGFVRSITTDAQGRIYVGTRTGLAVLSPEYKHQRWLERWPIGVSGNGEVQALVHDRRGRLWIGTDRRGLGYLNKNGAIRWLSIRNERGETIQSVYSITPLTDSTIAVSIPNAVAVLDTRTFRSVVYSIPRTQRNVVNIARCIVSMTGGRYLLGTEHGLFVGAFDTQWDSLKCKDRYALEPNANIIRSIAIRNDTAFIGTWGGGIRALSLATFNEHVVDARHGLPNNTVYSVVPRRDGSLIAMTNAGIVILRSGNIVGQISRDQGAQSNEFNTGAWYIDNKGNILAGGVHGFNVIPSNVRGTTGVVRATYLLAADIDGVQLPDSSVYGLRELVIPSSATSFSLTIAPIMTSRALSMRYRYALRDGAGDTTRWTTTATPTLRFASVAPGSYELVIEAQRGFGPWTVVYRLPVRIVPPWWQTWWALLTFGVTGLSVPIVSTAAVIRRREIQKREREQLLTQERLRIARDLHDEVGSGLARIVVLADAQSRVGQAVDTAKIADTARNVMASVRSIAWVMKSGQDTITNTVEYIRDKAEEYFADQGIEFGFEMSVALPDRSLSVLERRNLILSAQEAITNITKHSQASSVLLSCSAENECWVLSFRDNGVGMSHEKTSDTSGIDNMKTRMHEVGFRLEIRSNPHSGTEIRFILS